MNVLGWIVRNVSKLPVVSKITPSAAKALDEAMVREAAANLREFFRRFVALRPPIKDPDVLEENGGAKGKNDHKGGGLQLLMILLAIPPIAALGVVTSFAVRAANHTWPATLTQGVATYAACGLLLVALKRIPFLRTLTSSVGNLTVAAAIIGVQLAHTSQITPPPADSVVALVSPFVFTAILHLGLQWLLNEQRRVPRIYIDTSRTPFVPRGMLWRLYLFYYYYYF